METIEYTSTDKTTSDATNMRIFIHIEEENVENSGEELGITDTDETN